MAFFWFLLLVAVLIWGVRAAGAAKRLTIENARLASEKATLDAYSRSAHASYQTLQQSYEGLRAHNRNLQASCQTLQAQYTALQQHAQQLEQYAHRVNTENESLARYRPLVNVDAEVAARRAAIDEQERASKLLLDAYRRESIALKNTIEGYGDRYLVATRNLLDDLGEEFAHTDAGQRLKEARQRSRDLIKAGRAAVCGYVEDERRQAAIEFVIDAFNGKADSILVKAKTDNFGTLEQQLNDAFALVNMNGRAFRDARITSTYLDARLEELRWAVILHELREQEREEQRALKEQIREEEKARREYERAQKEAAKEEDVIRRAMAKAQQEIAQATDAQRAKYEAQLQELAVKLQAAEEKNRRAISMAQQTKRGHVYIISNVGSFGEDVFKIGLTRRLEPLDRVKELGDASVPFEFDVHAMIPSDDAPALEHALHRHFLASQMNKVNPRKEFFRATLTKIREEVEKLGVQASWTMMAAAAQYRESVAIERAIKNDPNAYQAWVNRQLVLDRTLPEEGEPEPQVMQTPAVAMAAN